MTPRTIKRKDTIFINQKLLVIALVFVVLTSLLGFWLGRIWFPAINPDSPEVGFARDMATHHSQAVEMALLVRDRSDDPRIRQLALDIMLTQQTQIGQIQGWLALWSQPLASTKPAMTWMGMAMSGPMPGMATSEQLDELRSANGPAADALFLQLMIPHHRGGIAMAEAILGKTNQPVVRRLADAIVYTQTSEIAYMQDLLEGLP